MQNPYAMHLYEYAIVRYMPDAARGEFVNIGLLMMCKRRRWIRTEISLQTEKLQAMAPDSDAGAIDRQCDVFRQICSGKPADHPIASLPAEERFRWLTAVRSASIVTSRPHPGKCDDLDSTFARLYSELVL
ncbi:MAG: DUF3037 domain-containing protein [Muribaculaceae bacterium]|nr:DUF3037 domain-containing protein [Muribaculaceae bacterium]